MDGKIPLSEWLYHECNGFLVIGILTLPEPLYSLPYIFPPSHSAIILVFKEKINLIIEMK
jgi:hypothetical protein